MNIAITALLLLAAPDAASVQTALVGSDLALSRVDAAYLLEDTSAWTAYLVRPETRDSVLGLAETCRVAGATEALTAMLRTSKSAVAPLDLGVPMTRLPSPKKPSRLPGGNVTLPADGAKNHLLVAVSGVGFSEDGRTAAACLTTTRGLMNGGGSCHVLMLDSSGAWASACSQAQWHW